MMILLASRAEATSAHECSSQPASRAQEPGDQVVVVLRNPYIQVRPSATFSSIPHSKYPFAPHY